jgi:outer membrane protein assembly factor BamA
LGGLDKIRGFEASRFYGRNFWLGNIEFRIPVLDKPLYVVQFTGFTDSLGVSLNKDALREYTAASAGIGHRFVAPTVYRLVLRADYAVPFKNQGEQPLSFGIQQFF